MPGKGVYASASAMYAESRRLDVVAQNLANANTTGFRRAVPLLHSFSQLLAEQGKKGLQEAGGAGIFTAGVHRDFAPGERQSTASLYDVALGGSGFLVAQDKNGDRLLTRDGHFALDDQRRLILKDGSLVLGQGGPIGIPAESSGIDIDADGRIYSRARDGSSQFVEQLQTVEVDDPTKLVSRGGAMFALGKAQTSDAKNPNIVQGFLEVSNVQPVTELVKMIDLQRRYDAAQRATKTQMEVGGRLSELLGGSS